MEVPPVFSVKIGCMKGLGGGTKEGRRERRDMKRLHVERSNWLKQGQLEIVEVEEEDEGRLALRRVKK